MVKVIDSEVVIRAYFNKYRERTELQYAELKRIRYKAEPYMGFYIDVTYTSLRRVQQLHRSDLTMDQVKITIVKDALRVIHEAERPVVKLLDKYL